MRRKRGWMQLRVHSVKDDTHDTKTFYLVDHDDNMRAFDYHAGQYLTLRFDGVAEKPVVRSYTMSSSPCEPDYVALTVKRVEHGLISNHMCDQLVKDSVIRALGPIGKFCYEPEKDGSHLYMVAAGSGVTPFVSIMREYASLLGKPGAPKKMTLLVAYRSMADLICWDDLKAINAQEGCHVVTTLTRENNEAGGFWYGRPNADMMRRAVGNDWQDVTVMTCGPEEMMQLVVETAKAAGLPDERIKQESFNS